jgi:hypothetical protein
MNASFRPPNTAPPTFTCLTFSISGSTF